MAFSLAVAIGATIGGGIMRMPGEVAAYLPSQGLFLCAWILGGINALMGATVFAELGAMMPLSGGLYTLIVVFFAGRIISDTSHSLVTIAVLVVTAPLFFAWKKFARVRSGLPK